MLAPRQEDRGTNRRTNGRKCTCNPAPHACCLHPFLPFERETEKTFEIAYCRLLSEAAVSSAARQLGSFGVCRRSWSRRSRCRRQLDSREWAHCAGIVCVCVCGAAGDFSTCRIVRSDKEPKCQYTWQRRCRNSS